MMALTQLASGLQFYYAGRPNSSHYEATRALTSEYMLVLELCRTLLWWVSMSRYY